MADIAPQPAAITTEVLGSQAADHAIYLLLDFPCLDTRDEPALLSLTIASLDSDGRLAIVHPQRRAQEDARPVFTRATLTVGDDLHPTVLAALSDRVGTGEGARGLPCLRLTDPGRSVLNGGQVRPPGRPAEAASERPRRGLALWAGPESRKRLTAPQDAEDGGTTPAPLLLSITDLTLLTFPSRVGLAVLELRLATDRPSLAALQEAIHVLSHSGRARSVGWAAEPEHKGRFTLPDLVTTVLQPAGCAPEVWNRVFTYVFARFDAFPDETGWAEQAAWRLSRHYTSAYRAGPDFAAGSALVRPFDDVVHAACVGGAATVASGESAFMAQAFRDRVRACYLPLAILAYHEQVQLIGLAQRAIGPVQDRAEIADDQLRELIDQFLAFRLRYRMPVVSDVTMHNLFYDALRAGLRLDQLTRKVTEDMTEAKRSLRQANARETQREEAQRERARLRRERQREREEADRERAHLRRERRRAPILGLFAGLLTLLTGLAAFKEVRADLPADIAIPAWVPAWVPTWGPFVLAVLLALLSVWITWRRHADIHRDRAPRHGRESAEDDIGDELQADREAEGVHIASEASDLPGDGSTGRSGSHPT